MWDLGELSSHVVFFASVVLCVRGVFMVGFLPHNLQHLWPYICFKLNMIVFVFAMFVPCELCNDH